jgi:ADP-ribose pyrophosphatase YjhB (NUDIX family)
VDQRPDHSSIAPQSRTARLLSRPVRNRATIVVMNPADLGPVDRTLDPVPNHEDRRGPFTLMARGWMPPVEQVTQSYGLCGHCRQAGRAHRRPSLGWNLPGGTVEPGEELLETLVREVAEEACARVIQAEYLASQHVHDPDDPFGRTSYFQSRWWARVELDRWAPRFETTERRLVAPEVVATEISWRDKTILTRLMEFALEVENRHG